LNICKRKPLQYSLPGLLVSVYELYRLTIIYDYSRFNTLEDSCPSNEAKSYKMFNKSQEILRKVQSILLIYPESLNNMNNSSGFDFYEG